MRSSFCNFGDCVEVLPGAVGLVRVRDSREPGFELVFTREEWTAFLSGVKNGESDLPVGGGGIGSDPHWHDVPEPRPWGEPHGVPDGYAVAEFDLSVAPPTGDGPQT